MEIRNRRLGRYELLECIGEGGMGEVYRARDERLGRPVAIKILRAELADRTAFRHRFAREAKILARLNHPSICTLHDVGNDNGVDYLVLECLEGESLSARLRANALPVDAAIRYASQIAEALAAAHRVGLVHRDLKPSNVFITGTGAKLLDFGIARFLPASIGSSDTTQTGTDEGVVLGTSGYIAPEVLEGQAADAASDMFSYGAVLFEMFAGRPAFAAENKARVSAAVLSEAPPSLRSVAPKIPREVERLVADCLIKDRHARWQSAHDAFLELQGLQTHPSEIQRAIGIITPPLALHRLTFNRGTIYSARFVPEGRDVIYSAAWEGEPIQIYLTRPESPESRPMGFGTADLLAVSAGGNLALSLDCEISGFVRTGVLARVPVAGSQPRRMMDDVLYADWTPGGEEVVVVRRVRQRCQLEWPLGRVVYETSGLISHPRLSRDSALLAFIDHPLHIDDGGAVVVSDGTTAPRIVSDGWRSIWGLAWSPDNREVWFTATRGGAPRALRAVTLSDVERLISQMTVSLTVHDVSATGDTLVSHDALRTTVLFRGDDGRIETDLSYLDATFPRDLSGDGALLLFDETAEGGGSDYSVYVRRTAGGPPVRIGSGRGQALSPDKSWAVTVPWSMQGGLNVVPTGVGERYTLQQEMDTIRAAKWLPDGQHVVFSGAKHGAPLRLFVQNIASGKRRAISPPNMIGPTAVAPDGKRVVGINVSDRSTWLLSVQREESPTLLNAVLPAEVAAQWSADGAALFLRPRGGMMPQNIYRLDISTGSKTVWKQVRIPDRAGVSPIADFQLTPDGRHYVLTYRRVLSDLFMMQGVC